MQTIHFPKIHRSVLCKITFYFIFEMFMTSICEKNISAEVRLIYVEQVSLYIFVVLRKNNRQQLKQDILNQWESMGFSKLNLS